MMLRAHSFRPYPRPPVAPPDRFARERGVYRYVDRGSGETVRYAITSTGALLNAELRRVFDDETGPMVEDAMWRDLDRQDRVRSASGRRPSGALPSPGQRGQLQLA